LHTNRAKILSIIVCTALFALASTGCGGTKGNRAAEPPLLQSAATSLLGGDANQAVTQYTDFLGTNPDSPKAAEAYLGRGNAYFKLEKYDLAEADYKSALDKASDKTVKAQATMGLGNAAVALERFDAAEKIYRQVMSAYGGVVPQDEVTYRLGLSVARQGKWDDAYKYFDKVVTSWPSGEYAKYAKAKLAVVKDKAFTVQVGAFTNKALADAAVKQLTAAHMPARIETISSDTVQLYAVRSGSFPTWQAASEHSAKLQRAGFKSPARLP
jgi:tetratricopeptide (TPR) repeat protein